MKLFGRMLVLAFASVLAACTTDVVPVPADTTTACNVNVVRSVVVIPASATVHVGDTLRVSMPIYDTGPQCTRGPLLAVRWSSSDTLVAVVDSSAGLVKARGRGTVSIIGNVVKDPTIQGAMVLVVAS